MALTFADVLKKKEQRAEQADRLEIEWFSLKNNNPARVVFLQELDPDAPNFDSAKGGAVYLVEHANPEKFTRKAKCTMETKGRCVGCELNEEFPGDGWWAKTNFYVQVFDAKDQKVKVLSRPAPGGFFDTLTDWARDENEGNVTGVTFKISKGSSQSAPWTLTTTKNELEVPDGLVLQDLSKLGLEIDVEKQRNFYLPDGLPSKEKSEKKPEETESTEALDW